MSDSDRSMDGLRETLFDALDKLRAGKMDYRSANAIAGLASTLIKTVEVQMTWEKLKLDSKVPANMPTMPLIPKIKPSGRS
jgi:uncharacterized membrane protein YkvI